MGNAMKSRKFTRIPASAHTATVRHEDETEQDADELRARTDTDDRDDRAGDGTLPASAKQPRSLFLEPRNDLLECLRHARAYDGTIP